MTPNVKSKIKLSFLLLITILPISLATFYFRSVFESGEIGVTRNKGTLINPPADISDLMMRDASGDTVFKSFEDVIATLGEEEEYILRPWLMVYVTGETCNEECKERIYYMKQLHIALGKNIQRVRRYYLDASSQGITPELTTLFRNDYPSMGVAFSDKLLLEKNMKSKGVNLSLDSESYILLVDPVGNVMMYYTKEQSAEDIKADLETLLKYSSLG